MSVKCEDAGVAPAAMLAAQTNDAGVKAPCCAAAAVATAMNFLGASASASGVIGDDDAFDRCPDATRPFTACDVLDVYKSLLDAQVDKSRSRLVNMITTTTTTTSSKKCHRAAGVPGDEIQEDEVEEEEEERVAGRISLIDTNVLRRIEDALIQLVAEEGCRTGVQNINVTGAADDTADGAGRPREEWMTLLRKRGRKAIVVDSLHRLAAMGTTEVRADGGLECRLDESAVRILQQIVQLKPSSECADGTGRNDGKKTADMSVAPMEGSTLEDKRRNLALGIPSRKSGSKRGGIPQRLLNRLQVRRTAPSEGYAREQVDPCCMAGAEMTGACDLDAEDRAASVWDWQHDFTYHFELLAGRAKLSAQKPSTAAIGNVQLLRAIDTINGGQSLPGGRVFGRMVTTTKASKCGDLRTVYIKASSGHDALQVRREWNQLRDLFCEPESILVYHLVNHYCPIYAMREYWGREDATDAIQTENASPLRCAGECADDDEDIEVDLDGEDERTYDCTPIVATASSSGDRDRRMGGAPAVVMEVFCSRKGQHPDSAEWISFREVRDVILRWSGYGIIQVKRDDV